MNKMIMNTFDQSHLRCCYIADGTFTNINIRSGSANDNVWIIVLNKWNHILQHFIL